MASPDVFQYLDYRRFLSDWFQARQLANPRFSHRAFARKAGQSSPTFLLHITRAERNLTAATTTAVCKAMGLDGEHAEFFRSLVALAQAATHTERKAAWEEVCATRRFREARQLDAASVEYLAHWYLPAIRELAACDGFRADPAWIAARLSPPISVPEAERALALLVKLGLLELTLDGVRMPADPSVVTPHEVSAFAVTSYHTDMLGCARAAVQDARRDERHFLGVTVAIPHSHLALLKSELSKVQERLLELCDGAEETRDRVVQINLHFYTLARTNPPEST